MSAYDDLRNVLTALDSAVTGWIGYPWPSTTATGKEALQLVATLRQKRYRDWGENCALRSRLSRALGDIDDLRNANAIMTDDIERLERSINQRRKP